MKYQGRLHKKIKMAGILRIKEGSGYLFSEILLVKAVLAVPIQNLRKAVISNWESAFASGFLCS